jgi:hypothetical protein
MKTFADVKRRLQVGTKLKLVRNDWFPTGKSINSVREIVARQTKGIKFSGGRSWLYFPSAKEVVIESENSFSFLIDKEGAKVTYEFVGE